MKRFYIKDFIEDLNYNNLILYIGDDIDTDKLLSKLIKDKVNHLYNFENVINEKLMFIENCDLEYINIPSTDRIKIFK